LGTFKKGFFVCLILLIRESPNKMFFLKVMRIELFLLLNLVYFINLPVALFTPRMNRLYQLLSFFDFEMIQCTRRGTSGENATSTQLSQKLHIICHYKFSIMTLPGSGTFMVKPLHHYVKKGYFWLFSDITVPPFLRYSSFLEGNFYQLKISTQPSIDAYERSWKSDKIFFDPKSLEGGTGV